MCESRPVEVEQRAGVAILAMHNPILSIAVLDELTSILQTLGARSPDQPLLIGSAHPKVFLAGAHLGEIAELDEVSSAPYAERGRETIRQIETYPAPTVAVVNGSCSGGGFDLALACDALIAGPGASFAHPGIRRGLITGWSGTTRLPVAVGSMSARSALMATRELDPSLLSNHGPVRQTTDDPLPLAIAEARRMASLDPARWRLWRALRGPGFIDRFDAFMVHKL